MDLLDDKYPRSKYYCLQSHLNITTGMCGLMNLYVYEILKILFMFNTVILIDICFICFSNTDRYQTFWIISPAALRLVVTFRIVLLYQFQCCGWAQEQMKPFHYSYFWNSLPPSICLSYLYTGQYFHTLSLQLEAILVVGLNFVICFIKFLWQFMITLLKHHNHM